MGYDINVYLKDVNDGIITDWKEKLKGFGLDCEIHPDFSFNIQTGFLPFKYTLKPGKIQGYNGEDLISGFEMYIDDYSAQKDELEYCDEETGEILKRANKSIYIRIGTQDSMEFRFGMLSSAILAELLDGVVFNPQEGCYLSKKNMYSDIQKMIDQDDEYLNENGWKIHAFEEWR